MASKYPELTNTYIQKMLNDIQNCLNWCKKHNYSPQIISMGLVEYDKISEYLLKNVPLTHLFGLPIVVDDSHSYPKIITKTKNNDAFSIFDVDGLLFKPDFAIKTAVINDTQIIGFDEEAMKWAREATSIELAHALREHAKICYGMTAALLETAARKIENSL